MVCKLSQCHLPRKIHLLFLPFVIIFNLFYLFVSTPMAFPATMSILLCTSLVLNQDILVKFKENNSLWRVCQSSKSKLYYHLLVLSIPNPFFLIPNFAFIQKFLSSSTTTHSPLSLQVSFHCPNPVLILILFYPFFALFSFSTIMWILTPSCSSATSICKCFSSTCVDKRFFTQINMFCSKDTT